MAMIKNISLVTLLFSFGIELYAERPASDQADEDKFGNKHDWCAEVNYDHTLIIVDTTEKFNENQYELLQNQILNNSSIAKLADIKIQLKSKKEACPLNLQKHRSLKLLSQLQKQTCLYREVYLRIR